MPKKINALLKIMTLVSPLFLATACVFADLEDDEDDDTTTPAQVDEGDFLRYSVFYAEDSLHLANIFASDVKYYAQLPEGETSRSCGVTGQVDYTFSDADQDGTISAGDSIQLQYTTCSQYEFSGSASGGVTAEVLSYDNGVGTDPKKFIATLKFTTDSLIIERNNGSLKVSTTEGINADINIDLNLQSTLAFSLGNSGISYTTGTKSNRIFDTQITHISRYNDSSTSVELNGTVQANGYTLDFETSATLLTDSYQRYPKDGIFQVTNRGNKHAVRLSPEALGSGQSSDAAHISFDKNADGNFETGYRSSWSNYITGGLFTQFLASTYASNPTDPNPDFQILSTVPTTGTANVNPLGELVFTFSSTINSASVNTPINISVAGNTIQIPYTHTVSENTLTITFSQSLEYGQEYLISLNNIRDTNNTWLGQDSMSELSFTTKPYENAMDIGVALHAIEYDANNNVLYGIDNINKSLLKIDLTAKSVTSSTALTYIPDDLCLDPVNNRIFIVNKGSSFISEYDLVIEQVVANISWPAPSYGENSHYQIKCAADRLLLADAEWTPGLWIVDLSGTLPVVNDFTTSVSSIGSMVLTQDRGSLYYWRQSGWSESIYGTYIVRRDLNTDGFPQLDSSSNSSVFSYTQPLGAPIFLDETSGYLLNDRFAFNASNLSEIYYTLPQGEAIYAASFAHQRFATGSKIYDLNTFNPIALTPSTKADLMFYDKDGVLYQVINRKSSIYYYQEP